MPKHDWTTHTQNIVAYHTRAAAVGGRKNSCLDRVVNVPSLRTYAQHTIACPIVNSPGLKHPPLDHIYHHIRAMRAIALHCRPHSRVAIYFPLLFDYYSPTCCLRPNRGVTPSTQYLPPPCRPAHDAACSHFPLRSSSPPSSPPFSSSSSSPRSS